MRIRSKKIVLVFLACGFLGLGVGLNLPLRGEEPPVVNPSPPTIAPEKQGEMQEIRLTEIQEGEKKWVLTATDADYLKDKDRIYLKKVWVEVFGKNNDNVTITGDSGFINIKSRDLTLEGNVQAHTTDYEFSSDWVHYDPKTHLLVAPGPIKVQGARLYLEGKGLTVDLRQKKLDVAEHKVTKLRVPGKLWNF
jgi:LPS export ABC transporter protein LptC